MRGLFVSQRSFLLSNHFTLLRHFRVQLKIVLPFRGQVIFVENGLYGAFRHTSFAVDAFFGMNVQHLLPLIEALHRANHYAVGISAAFAGLRYDVSHINKTFQFLKYEPDEKAV
jgi:hypothetical protein